MKSINYTKFLIFNSIGIAAEQGRRVYNLNDRYYLLDVCFKTEVAERSIVPPAMNKQLIPPEIIQIIQIRNIYRQVKTTEIC